MASVHSVPISVPAHIRAIELARRVLAAPDALSPNCSRYVGRVGALALALGVGSAVASMPMAFADTTGSAGSSSTADSTGAGSTTAGAGRAGSTAKAPPAYGFAFGSRR
jgi:hypothetical protein